MKKTGFFLTVLLVVLFSGILYADNIGLEEKEIEAIKLRIRIFHEQLQERMNLIEKILNRQKKSDEEYIERIFQEKVDTIRENSREKREFLIHQLENFILENKDSPLIAEPLLMLGELYYERDNDRFLKAMDEYARQLELYSTGKIKTEPQYPKLDYSDAIELFQEFVKRFPDHRKLEEALYMEAYCYNEMGEGKKAADIFQELIIRRPSSKLVPEAYFRLGEYYFDNAQLEKAVEAYKKVLSFKTPLYDKALYKLGWTYYRLENYDAAVNYFVSVINYASSHTTSIAASMKDEAIKYIAISFNDWTGLEGLKKFMEKIGWPSYAVKVFVELGNIYEQITKYSEAIKTYNYIVERFPYYEGNLDLLIRVMNIQIKEDNLDESFRTRLKIVKLFNPESDWFKHQRDEKIREKAKKEVEKLLYEYATYFHSQGQKAKKKKEKMKNYAKAIEGYRLFLKLFPESPKITDVTSLLADLYYEIGEYEKAGELYKKITQLIADPRKKAFKDAAFSMVLAYVKWLDQYEKSPEGKKSLEKIKKLEKKMAAHVTTATYSVTVTYGDLPLPARKMIEANRYYLELFPTSPDTAKIIYKGGEIFMRYGDYEDALREFEKIVYKFPDSPLIVDAVKNVVHCFTMMNRYGELYQWSEETLRLPAGQNSEVKKILRKILSGALFKKAKNLEKEKEYIRAAETYLKLAEKYPEAEFADKAIYNAGLLYDKSGNYFKAIRTFQKLAEKYPRSRYAPLGLFLAATIYEKILDFLSAADLYIQVFTKYPHFKRAPDALYNAAVWYEKWGDTRKAAELYLKYVKTFPKRKDVGMVLFFAADNFYKSGDYKKAEALFRWYIRARYKKFRLDALYKFAQCEKKLKKWKTYYKTLRQIIKEYYKLKKAGKPVIPDYAAEAEFQFAMLVYKKYERIKLKLPMKRMKRLLKYKAAMLKKAIAAMTKVIKFASPTWTTAALYYIGAAYKHFANTLYNAPVPAHLTPEEEDIYRQTLEEQAYPIEDKATEAFTKLLDVARKLKIENEWTQKAREYLAQFNEEYAKKYGKEIYLYAENDLYMTFPRTDEKNNWVKIANGKVIYLRGVIKKKVKIARKKAFYLEQREILEKGIDEKLLLDILNQSIPLGDIVGK